MNLDLSPTMGSHAHTVYKKAGPCLLQNLASGHQQVIRREKKIARELQGTLKLLYIER